MEPWPLQTLKPHSSRDREKGGFHHGLLEAICNTAKRFAFNRADQADELPPLAWSDFEKALERVKGAA